MEIPKLIILLCCLYYVYASHPHHVHTIPVENYETELQDLGEHVDIPETPVRVVKITKTVAVKVPVPYPVKVIEKVPYPVHINKPYPVPVPQIVKVPHVESPQTLPSHEALGSQDNSYQVQEQHSHDVPASNSYFQPENQSYHGSNLGHTQNFAPNSEEYNSEGSSGSSYEAPSHAYEGDADTFESRNYDQAIKKYFDKINANAAAHSYNH